MPTAKEKQEALELKYTKHCELRGKCEVCGKVVDVLTAQLAHIIPKTKPALKKWGPAIIHHPDNLKLVCSLKCNAAVMISPASKPIEAEARAEKIRSKLK